MSEHRALLPHPAMWMLPPDIYCTGLMGQFGPSLCEPEAWRPRVTAYRTLIDGLTGPLAPIAVVPLLAVDPDWNTVDAAVDDYTYEDWQTHILYAPTRAAWRRAWQIARVLVQGRPVLLLPSDRGQVLVRAGWAHHVYHERPFLRSVI